MSKIDIKQIFKIKSKEILRFHWENNDKDNRKR